jgi:hypothetical protein
MRTLTEMWGFFISKILEAETTEAFGLTELFTENTEKI